VTVLFDVPESHESLRRQRKNFFSLSFGAKMSSQESPTSFVKALTNASPTRIDLLARRMLASSQLEADEKSLSPLQRMQREQRKNSSRQLHFGLPTAGVSSLSSTSSQHSLSLSASGSTSLSRKSASRSQHRKQKKEKQKEREREREKEKEKEKENAVDVIAVPIQVSDDDDGNRGVDVEDDDEDDDDDDDDDERDDAKVTPTRRKSVKFSKEEDDKLTQGVSCFGDDWQAIVKWGQFLRTGKSLRERWKRLTKNSATESDSRSRGSSHGALSSGVTPSRKRTPSSSDVGNRKRVRSGHAPGTIPAAFDEVRNVLLPDGQQQQQQQQHIRSDSNSSSAVQQPSVLASGMSSSALDQLIAGGTSDPVELMQDRMRIVQEWTAVQQERLKLASQAQLLQVREQAVLAREQALSLSSSSSSSSASSSSSLSVPIASFEERVQALIDRGELVRCDDVNARFAEILVAHDRLERGLVRRKNSEDAYELGQAAVQRVGTQYVESWSGGALLVAVDARIAQLRVDCEEKKRDRNRLQREKSSRKKLLAAARDDGADEAARAAAPSDAEIREAVIEEEVTKLRVAQLRVELAQAEAAKQQLLVRRSIHRKETRRIGAEDNSVFNDNRRLGEQHRYLLLSMIGRGGFSEVWRAFDMRHYRFVACKIHQMSSSWNARKREDYARHAVRESRIQKALQHPRVVRLFDVFEIDDSSFCTVLEFCEGGDLDALLKRCGTLPEREAKIIVTQIFDGLAYLSSQKRPIIHYDLKPGSMCQRNNVATDQQLTHPSLFLFLSVVVQIFCFTMAPSRLPISA
jgi:Protein kinase domain/Myb-like DNA-binding domain